MKTDLTQEQIDAYERDGCLIVKEFLTTQELDELISAVSDCVKQMGKWKVAGDEDKKHVEGDTYHDQVFLQRVNLTRSRSQHDPGVATGDDVRLHARWCDLQWDSKHPFRRTGRKRMRICPSCYSGFSEH